MSKKSGSSASQAVFPDQAIRRRRIKLADRRAAFGLLKKAILLAAAVFVIFGFVFGLTSMKGGDMQPKFAAGDLLLYYRLQTKYARNDVIVMKRDSAQYVGRIIGIPGDTLEITDDKRVVVNGNPIVETEIFFDTERFEEAVRYPITLAEDEFFILGDNRETARDSRYFGAVRASEIKGKVITAIRRTDI